MLLYLNKLWQQTLMTFLRFCLYYKYQLKVKDLSLKLRNLKLRFEKLRNSLTYLKIFIDWSSTSIHHSSFQDENFKSNSQTYGSFGNRLSISRSSCPGVFCKKGVLENSKFCNFIQKDTLDFTKFSGTTFFIEYLWWLLPNLSQTIPHGYLFCEIPDK